RARGPHDATGQRAPPAGRPAWEARAGDSCAAEHFPRWRGGTAAGLGETRMTPAAYLNSLPVAAARAALGRCCGARHWVDAMLAARPFASDAELLATAERVWWRLGRADWLEAFAAHPRIGDPQKAMTDWARREQAGADGAAVATLTALAQGSGDGWAELAATRSDTNGRVANLLPGDLKSPAGTYRLRFDTGAYFAALGVSPFHPFVEIVFEIRDAEQYHVPLLVSPFGY